MRATDQELGHAVSATPKRASPGRDRHDPRARRDHRLEHRRQGGAEGRARSVSPLPSDGGCSARPPHRTRGRFGPECLQESARAAGRAGVPLHTARTGAWPAHRIRHTWQRGGMRRSRHRRRGAPLSSTSEDPAPSTSAGAADHPRCANELKAGPLRAGKVIHPRVSRARRRRRRPRARPTPRARTARRWNRGSSPRMRCVRRRSRRRCSVRPPPTPDRRPPG